MSSNLHHEKDGCDSEKCLLSSPSEESLDEKRFNHSLKQHCSPWYSWSLLLVNLVIFCISVGLSLQKYKLSESECASKTSYYSPVPSYIQSVYHTVTINGSFFNLPPSIYREPPSPDVDAAWDRISLTATVLISSKEVLALGKDPSTTVRTPISFNHGSDANLAQIDAFHQIHCLNMIRKTAYQEYYFSNGFPDPVHWTHVSHCFGILLQNLMCSASTDIITHNWVEKQPKPFPDFEIKKQCRDFETLRSWADDRTLPEAQWLEMKIPDGVTPLPAPDALWEVFGLDKPTGIDR